MLVVAAFFISVILHNLIGALIGVEEAFFFIVAVFVIPIYILIAVPFTVISIIKNRRLQEQK